MDGQVTRGWIGVEPQELSPELAESFGIEAQRPVGQPAGIPPGVVAEPIDQAGFVFMDSPGYDPVACTGQSRSTRRLPTISLGRCGTWGAGKSCGWPTSWREQEST
mgnify:CR=1 FL=1